MSEEEKKASEYSFIQETIKQKPFYQNRTVRRIALSAVSGIVFAVTALAVWAFALPRLMPEEEEPEVQQIEIPEEEPEAPEEDEEESTVYITETISMELEDYKSQYQKLIQLGTQAEKSLVTISAMTVDTDWFDEAYVSRSSVSGMLIGDNGLEILVLTEYQAVREGEELQVTFFDHTTAPGSLKKYDKNTGLAIVSVNLSDVSEATRGIILYADLGSSKALRSGEPVIAVGRPLGSSASLLFGNLTSVSQTASLFDGSYNVLTTDMAKAENSSGVLVDWNGRIVGIIQGQCMVSGQENTIQAYGISDLKQLIELLSNNQEIVYMGITGADVTTSISEAQGIPVGVYVSEVAMDSPAMEGGMQPGDIITGISGQPVTNLKDVMSILMKCSNGQTVQVLCQRADKDDYQQMELSVTLTILE